MKPEFHLTRLFDDGTAEPPQVIPVAELPWSTAMNRRGALATGLGLTGVLAMLDGCASAPPPPAPRAAPPPDPVAPPRDCTAPNSMLQADRGPVAFIIALRERAFAIVGSGNTVKLWSLQEGKPTLTIRGQSFSAGAVTPDGASLVTGTWGGGIALWSLADGAAAGTMEGGRSGITSLAVSGDGKMLAAADDDGGVTLWNLTDRTALRRVEADPEALRATAFTADASTVITGGEDGAVKLWSAATGTLLKTLAGHRKPVTSLGLTADGLLLCSASRDGTVRLWALPDGRHVGTISADPVLINALAVMPDGRALATGGYTNVKLWSLPAGSSLGVWQGHYTAIAAIAATTDGGTILSGDHHGRVFLWDVTGCFRGYLFDPEATEKSVQALTYNLYDNVLQRTVTYTLPCGSPIPAGATCTCNCVPGARATVPSGGTTGGTTCTCVPVCTCVPISSRRWKRKIRPLGRALEQLARLRAVRFDWTDDAPQGRRGEDFGFIAEEVAEVFPEVVARDPDGTPRGIDYARLTAVLVEAVKEQQRQIDELEAALEKLK